MADLRSGLSVTPPQETKKKHGKDVECRQYWQYIALRQPHFTNENLPNLSDSLWNVYISKREMYTAKYNVSAYQTDH
jgi:hypothetical protein